MSKKSTACPRTITSTKIWDTRYCKPRETFSTFREGICNTFMPWAPEFKSDEPFDGRLEGVQFERGSMGRARMSPIVCVRNKSHIAGSTIDGFYANYIISGKLKVEQAGRVNIAKRGDLIVYDTSLPVVLTERAETHYEDLPILFSKDCFSNIDDAGERFGNILLPRDKLFSPLSDCLSLAASVSSLSSDEWLGLFDACAALLPLATECFDDIGDLDTTIDVADPRFRDALEFIDQNLSVSELSPYWVGNRMGISSRQIQRLFAIRGTTFTLYVLSKRLDYARRDLIEPNYRNHPTSSIARRWGFRDISNFDRAFYKRFGCNPSLFRKLFG